MRTQNALRLESGIGIEGATKNGFLLESASSSESSSFSPPFRNIDKESGEKRVVVYLSIKAKVFHRVLDVCVIINTVFRYYCNSKTRKKWGTRNQQHNRRLLVPWYLPTVGKKKVLLITSLTV